MDLIQENISVVDSNENGENSDVESSTNATPTRKRQRYEYTEKCQFETDADFQTWLAEEDTWTRSRLLNLLIYFSTFLRMTKRKELDNFTELYYCKIGRRLGEACQAMLKVIKTKETGKIEVFSNNEEHDHQPKRETVPPTDDVKRQMRLLIAQKMTAAQILNFLRVY
jgi:hypothetical protein